MAERNYLNRNIFITFLQYFMEHILFLSPNYVILDIFFPKLKKGNFIIFRLQEITTLIDKRSSKSVSVTYLRKSTHQRPNLICTFIYIQLKNIWYMHKKKQKNQRECNRPDSQLIQSNNRPNLENPRTDNATESSVILLPECMWTKTVPMHYESTICHKFVLVR